MLNALADRRRVLATFLITIVAAYIAWKIGQSPEQALQFTFNGLSVGAVYALLAMGFSIVYSTVWFFDLYYGAAATLGAYGVFYMRSQEFLGGRYAINSLFVNFIFAAVIAGVVAWVLHTAFYGRFRSRFSPTTLRIGGGVLSGAAGVYAGFVLTYPAQLHLTLSPAIGILAALAALAGRFEKATGAFSGIPSPILFSFCLPLRLGWLDHFAAFWWPTPPAPSCI